MLPSFEIAVNQQKSTSLTLRFSRRSRPGGDYKKSEEEPVKEKQTRSQKYANAILPPADVVDYGSHSQRATFIEFAEFRPEEETAWFAKLPSWIRAARYSITKKLQASALPPSSATKWNIST